MPERKTIVLDFHSIMSVAVSDAAPDIRGLVTRHLGDFSVGAGTLEKEPDIVVMPVDRGLMPQVVDLALLKKYGYYFSKYGNDDAIVFGHRGEPDIMLVMGQGIKALYIERPRMAAKLYGVILLAMNIFLYRKNSMIFHGALLTKDRTSLLIVGPGGTRKSTLCIKMLSDGWDYLSDDKFILHNGAAYLFNPNLIIRDRHIAMLPWLRERLPERPMAAKRKAIKRRVHSALEKRLPDYFLKPLDRFFDDAIVVRPDALFKGLKVVRSSVPTDVVILKPGQEVRIETVEREQALKEITMTEELRLDDMQKLEKCLQLFTKNEAFDLGGIIDANLRTQRFFRLSAPFDSDISDVYRELKACLRQP